MIARWALRYGVLAYLSLLLALPVGMVFYRAFEHGFSPAWHAVTTPEAKHAFLLTIEVAAMVVVANTIFGVALAIALVRHRFPGSGVVNAIVDLPLAVSPVVVGLALYLLYGRGGWFGAHVHVLFSTPAIVLATAFVSLPFVVREVVPVLREIGTEQEQAAATLGAGSLQTFRRITFPAIRWAVAYGVVLTTARAIGEYGAVSVVSGNVEGKTQTLTLYVQGQFENNIFDLTGAYAASVLLALIALATVVAMTIFRPREGT
jgi:sulfate transport system permease protein